MNAAPRELAARILDDPTDLIDVSTWLQAECARNGDLSELEAFDRAESIRERVIREIGERLYDLRQRGLMPPHDWIDDHRLLGRPHGDATRAQLSLRDAIRTALNELTGTQFEHVVKHLLEASGANPCAVVGAQAVGSQGDRGIDVVALVSGPTRPLPDRFRTLPVRIAAQAKLRAGGHVDNNDVDAFARRLDNLRNDGDIAARMPAWFRSETLPIVGLLATAGRLLPAAKVAAAHGTISWIDGDQVVEDLARSPSVQNWLGADGVLEAGRFKAFLDRKPETS